MPHLRIPRFPTESIRYFDAKSTVLDFGANQLLDFGMPTWCQPGKTFVLYARKNPFSSHVCRIVRALMVARQNVRERVRKEWRDLKLVQWRISYSNKKVQGLQQKVLILDVLSWQKSRNNNIKKSKKYNPIIHALELYGLQVSPLICKSLQDIEVECTSIMYNYLAISSKYP